MGLLDKFERGVEKAVKSPFAKAFRSEVQPVEIASAIRRAMDDRATVIAHGRTMVPNVFTIELSPNDFDRLDDFADTIGDDLIAAAQEHAEVQRYTPGGPIEVHLEEATDLATGVFRVNPETTRDGSAAKPQVGMPSASAPGPAPSAPAGSAPRSGMPSAQVPAPAQSSAAPVPAEPAASPSPASAAHSQKSSQSSDSEFARPAVDYPDALAEPDSDAADDDAESVGGQAGGAASSARLPEAFPAYPVPGPAHGPGAAAAAGAAASAAAAGAAATSSAPGSPAPAPAQPRCPRPVHGRAAARPPGR